MAARIYKPARTAMQSGEARTQEWLLEFEATEPRRIEPLMGWTSSGDTRQQLRLRFATKEDAVAYARRHGLDFEVDEPKPRRHRPKAYAENFSFGRREPWTH